MIKLNEIRTKCDLRQFIANAITARDINDMQNAADLVRIWLIPEASKASWINMIDAMIEMTDELIDATMPEPD